MKENSKVYWKGIEELANEPEFVKNAQNEFPEFLPIKETNGNADETSGHDRRDFLKLLGFSVAAVSLAACEAPVKKAIPYLNKPEEIEPGVANYYASTFMEAGDYAAVLVKTREGRPIKIEGNKMSGVTAGGTGARAQASVLSLYDSARLQGFAKVNGGKTQMIAMKDADDQIIKSLNAIAAENGAIRIVSPTILSPSTKKVIAKFKEKYPTTEHIMYDANSVYGLLKANEIHFGQAVIPSYDFSKADVIVGIGADFLGTWISPVEYAGQYAKTRKLGKSKKTMSRHYQFEANLSLTGSNADYREPIKPSQEALFVAELYKKVTGNSISTPAVTNDKLEKAYQDLIGAKGKSIVVSGSNDVNVQLLVNEINKALGNYGNTIDISTPSYLRQGNDEQMNAFVDALGKGEIAGVIFYGSNAAYDHARGEEISKAISKLKLSVSFADRADETASLCQYVCPDHHYLEAWNDAEPKKGFYSLAQPTITPIFKTRAAQESLLTWSGNNADYLAFLQENWNSNILKGASWDQALHDGVFQPGSSMASVPVADSLSTASVEPTPVVSGNVSFNSVDYTSVAEKINSAYKLSGTGLELKLYQKIGLGTGVQANNPWLQELPDPISKATWDNYVAVSMSYANTQNLKQDDVVKVTVGGKVIGNLPVLIQPGQAKETVSIAIGYGRTNAGKCGDGVGVNVYPANTFVNGSWSNFAGGVKLEPTGTTSKIAQTQTHHTIMNRPIVQDATLEEYIKNPSAGRYIPLVTDPRTGEKVAPAKIDIWKEDHPKVGHLWGMSIDLNSCLGCGACVVACQAENNIAVVGKREVINRREMHWLRIDRYYSSEVDEKNPVGKYFKGNGPSDFAPMEVPTENPQVTFQPMLCQHCNHAPCETVCPVAATTHSSEGLNQMAYNRCVGTRYCANNCPYKVRRFNWFKYFDNSEMFDKNYAFNDSLGRMVLNPDVTVRSRGVMEKCSFCVQKIQEGKLIAKKEKRKLKDGEFTTACAAACATGAIVFGDQNDAESAVSISNNVENKERAYTVLEELNVQPNIYYLTKIRNTKA